MKKLFTLVLAVCALVSVEAQKKVGYFGMTKTMTGGLTDIQDPLLVLLKNDPNFVVTTNYTTVKTENPTYDLSGYDLIIVQESTAGDATVLMPNNSLALAKISKPCLYNKNFAFKKSRALTTTTTSTSTGAETKGIYTLTVDPANQTNDLFKAVTFTNNTVTMFNGGANDFGADTDTKALSYVTGLTLTPANTPLATVTGVASQVLCVNDLPANTMIDDQTITARFITVGLNFGAICKSQGNLTVDGLTILRNAVYILGGLTVPSTPAEIPTALSKVKKDNGSVLAVEGGVRINVASTSKVSIYSIDGKMIASKQISGTETIACQKGVYMVRVNDSAVKVMVSK